MHSTLSKTQANTATSSALISTQDMVQSERLKTLLAVSSLFAQAVYRDILLKAAADVPTMSLGFTL